MNITLKTAVKLFEHKLVSVKYELIVIKLSKK